MKDRPKSQEHLVDWLRDAHGMEQQAEELLEKQAKRLESYPELQQRVRLHTDETRRQAERLKRCLDRYDASSSGTKNVVGKLMGNMAAMTGAMAEDEVVKNVLGDYAFEHFEIAAYRSLIEAAETLGDAETAAVCRENLREEEAMASWVGDHIQQITRSFIGRDISGQQSKR